MVVIKYKDEFNNIYDERFKKTMCSIEDLKTDKKYIWDYSEEEGDMLEMIKLLNELNNEILELRKENNKLKTKIIILNKNI